jgi:WD40 repeat protein
VNGVAMDYDSGCLVTGDSSGVVNFWNGHEATRVGGSVHGPGKVIAAIAGAGRFSTAGWDNTVRSGPIGGDFDAAASLPAQPFDLANAGEGRSVAVTRSGIYFVNGGAVTSSKDTTYEPKTVSVSPAMDQIAVGGNDMKIHLYALAGDQIGDETAALEWHQSPVTAVAYSPDGAHLASGDGANKIIVWDRAASKVKIQGRWNKHGTAISCLAFSRDGQFLASGSMDSHVFIWNLENKRVFTQIPFANKEGVNDVAFGLENTTVYTVGQDSCIRTWNVTLPM